MKEIKKGLKIVVTVALLLMFSAGFLAISHAQQNGVPGNVKKYDVKDIDPAAVKEKVKRGEIVEIDFGARENGERRIYKLKLEPNDLLAPDAKIILHDGEKDIELPKPEVSTYKGKILGAPKSSVRMSITDEWISGYVIGKEGWFFIEPLSRYDNRASKTKHFTYNVRDVESRINFENDTIDTSQNTETRTSSNPNSITSVGGSGTFLASISKYADIYLTSDAEFYNINPSNWAARQMSVLNYADDPYISQTSVGFRVGLQHTYTSTSNQAYTSTDPTALWYQIRDRWYGSGGARDLVFALIGKDLNGCVVGIARQDSLGEASTYYHYGLGQMVWDPCSLGISTDFEKAWVTAHEMGHIFNANHEYAECDWWSTTIMGNCGALTKSFEFSDGVPNPSLNNKQRIIDKSAVLGP